jgi:hypothetical protein
MPAHSAGIAFVLMRVRTVVMAFAVIAASEPSGAHERLSL